MAGNKRRGNNEGTIYQRADGRWEASVFEYKNGKRRKVSRYAKTQDEARQKLTAMKSRQDHGLTVQYDRMSVGQWLDVWLKLYIEPKKRPRTWASYHSTVENNIKPGLGHVPLKELRPEMIEPILNEHYRAGRTRTAQYIRAVLRSALNRAKKNGHIPVNPAVETDAVTVIEKETSVFSEEEINRFLAATEGDRLEALFWVALGLGLRKGELLGLRPEDIDLDKRQLTVRRTVQFLKLPGSTVRQLVVGPPKSKESQRELPLVDCVYRALVRHFVRREEEKTLAGSAWKESGYLFTSTIGTVLDQRNVTVRFEEISKAAEVPRLRFHDLRHSCGTLLHMHGADAFTIQKILGHSQITTTRRYTKVTRKVQLAALERMEAAMTVAKPNPVTVKTTVKPTPESIQ